MNVPKDAQGRYVIYVGRAFSFGTLGDVIRVKVTDSEKHLPIKEVEVRFELTPPEGGDCLPVAQLTNEDGEAEAALTAYFWAQYGLTLKTSLPEFIDSATGLPLSDQIEVIMTGAYEYLQGVWGKNVFQIGIANQTLENPLKTWYIINRVVNEQIVPTPVTFKVLIPEKPEEKGYFDHTPGLTEITKSTPGLAYREDGPEVIYTCGSKTTPQLVEASHTYTIEASPATEVTEKVYFAVGPPEVRLVKETSSGSGMFEEAKYIIPWDPFREPYESATKYYIEAKMPVTEPDPIDGGIAIWNICRKGVTQIEGAIAPVGVDKTPLQRVATYDWYALYRTPLTTPLVFIDETLPAGATPPYLPSASSPIYVQVWGGGFGQPFVYGDERQNGPPVPVPKVTISGPFDIMEGTDSESFTVVIIPPNLNVTAYQWVWSAPAGAGNNPQVNFDKPTEKSTIIKKSRWFAYPKDSNWLRDAGPGCWYDVNCEVTIAGVKCNDKKAPKRRVYVPGAQTINPKVVGFPILDTRESPAGIEWYVKDKGDLRRSAPEIKAEMPATSQFYHKVVEVHEACHVTQYNEMEPWKDLWDANKLYEERLKALHAITREDLESEIKFWIWAENKTGKLEAFTEENVKKAEKEAFAASNAVEPHYLEMDPDNPVDWVKILEAYK